MEFETEREEALYGTLKQVLQNHVSTHRLNYRQTLAACIPVLGYVLYVMIETWEDALPLIERTLTELKQQTHARARRTHPPLPTFPDSPLDTAQSAQGHELGTALATFLATVGMEHNMSVTATRRAYLSLLADVLAMPLYAAEKTLEEADAYIDSLRDQLPMVMRLWHEEQR
jgi:hypothetical protein